MAVSKVEVGSLLVAAVAVIVSIGIAVHQSSQTRDALFESRVQSRVASCVSLGALYASQSWAYNPIVVEEYAKYGIAPGTPFDPDGPNLLLANFSHKSIATGRALQLCLVESEDKDALESCITTEVDGIDDHKVDDDTPPDGTLDNLIC
ncbi:MAG: hypothetical protein JXR13_06745 [Thalassovita sp.]